MPQINSIFIQVFQSLIPGMYTQQTKYTMHVNVEKMQVSQQSQSVIYPPTTKNLPFHYKTHQKLVPPFMKHSTVLVTDINFQNQNHITKRQGRKQVCSDNFGTTYNCFDKPNCVWQFCQALELVSSAVKPLKQLLAHFWWMPTSTCQRNPKEFQSWHRLEILSYLHSHSAWTLRQLQTMDAGLQGHDAKEKTCTHLIYQKR